DENAWGRTNLSDLQSLQVYLNNYPNGGHKSDAQRLRDGLQKAVAQPAQAVQLKKDAVKTVFSSLAAAFQARKVNDLMKVWPNAPQSYKEILKVQAQDVTLAQIGEIQILSEVSATVDAKMTLKIHQPIRSTESNVRVTFEYDPRI